MRRFFLSGLAAVSALALLSGPASALRIAVMPNASTKTKVIQSEAVVVGKVSGIDAETVELEQYPGGPKVAHTVANIKIESGLLGVKNATHLKIAFVKPGADAQPGGPGGRPPIGRGGQPAYTPAEDQEGVFFLQKHPTSDNHYVVQPTHPPLLSADPNYKTELATVKAMSGTFADPVKALSAEKEEERVANALSLAQKYRSAPQLGSGLFDETPIAAEQTKLFLKVLSEVDWAKHADAPRLADALGLMPGNYGLPRVTAADGEEPMAARQKAFKAWADKYGAKFEVKKVSAKPVEKGTGGPGATPVPPIIRR
jgi:hypothetical protein